MRYDYKEVFKEIVLPELGSTIYMVFFATIFSIIIGFILAVILYLTDDNGLKPNKIIYTITNTIVNVVRSFPFLILMVSIIPFTRAIVGTSIGKTAALVPLTMAGGPFFARLFETSFSTVDKELIEAALSLGASTKDVITKVVVRESVPSLIQNITNGTVSILGTSSAAGAIGAGGLGAIALMYGYQNFDSVIMYGTVLIIILLVQIIQFVGSRIYRRSR